MTGRIGGVPPNIISNNKDFENKNNLKIKKEEISSEEFSSIEELKNYQEISQREEITDQSQMEQEEKLLDVGSDTRINNDQIEAAREMGDKIINELINDVKESGFDDQDAQKIAALHINTQLSDLHMAIKQNLLDKLFYNTLNSMVNIDKQLKEIDSLPKPGSKKDYYELKLTISNKETVLVRAKTKKKLKNKIKKMANKQLMSKAKITNQMEFDLLLKHLSAIAHAPYISLSTSLIRSSKVTQVKKMFGKSQSAFAKMSPSSTETQFLKYLPSSIDSAMLLGAIDGIMSMKVSLDYYKKAKTLGVQAEQLQRKGKHAEAKAMKEEAEKQLRIGLGLYSGGTLRFVGSLSISASGVLGFCSAINKTLATSVAALGITGGSIGILTGSLTFGLGLRNIYKGCVGKETIKQLEDEIIKEYAMWPGTEEETQCALQLCEKFKEELNVKIGVNAIRSAKSASIIGASACSIAAITGVSSTGLGTIVLGGASLVGITGQIGYKKYKKRQMTKREHFLLDSHRATETKAGLIATLRCLVESEHLSENLGGLKPESIFANKVVPTLFGIDSDIFLKSTETIGQLYEQFIKDERQDIWEALQLKKSAVESEEVKVDPVWEKRKKEFLEEKKIGKMYRHKGIDEIKEEFKMQKRIDEISRLRERKKLNPGDLVALEKKLILARSRLYSMREEAHAKLSEEHRKQVEKKAFLK